MNTTLFCIGRGWYIIYNYNYKYRFTYFRLVLSWYILAFGWWVVHSTMVSLYRPTVYFWSYMQHTTVTAWVLLSSSQFGIQCQAATGYDRDDSPPLSSIEVGCHLVRILKIIGVVRFSFAHFPHFSRTDTYTSPIHEETALAFLA